MIVPVFVFDSREKWFPVGVEEALELATQPLPWGFPAITATVAPEYRARIDFPAGMTQPDLPPVGYHRMQRGGGLYWHQWWLFYLYNPWSVAGVGKHEGDWEFVQTGCVDEAGDRPVLVTCSQHHSGGKREFWATTLGSERTSPGRPFVYVARGSHANYFNRGIVGDGTDFCDGQGRILADIEWRPFGPWASWPGRWGNSDRSPESPARQAHRWSAPHLFHSSAR